MIDNITASDALTRFAIFLAILVAMAAWEIGAPRRHVAVGRRQRWPANLGIAAIDVVVLRIVLPSTLVGFALVVESHGWGLAGALDWPTWAAVVVSVVLLDLVIYLQHVLFHAVPVLWRVHRMHHSDLEFDVTTGVRFHPVEHLLSAAVKLAAIAALGAPAAGVLIFEVLLNATSMFNHANVRIPRPLERVLRWVVVTPDMHRVHHSLRRSETNSNFGFNLPWWDRLLGTYQAEPAAGHERMALGIDEFRVPGELGLGRLLIQPWLAIHRRTQTDTQMNTDTIHRRTQTVTRMNTDAIHR